MYVDKYEELTQGGFAKFIIRRSTQFFIRHSDAVVCTARLLEQDAKKNNRHVLYLPNAIDLDKFKRLPERSENRFVVGFVGSLGSWVDVDMIAESAKRIQREYPKIIFWIIGSGPGEDRLNFRIRDEKIKNIKLFGYMPHEEAIKRMFCFNISLIPFKVNDITDCVSPVKLFEYWMCGSLVIAVKTFELKQFKDELIFVDGASEMSEAIIKLYKSPSIRKSLAKKGKSLVVKRYNWGIYRNIYKKLVESV
jgi:glycosyltransferase involved in cell wall biosynthesis